jgi:hypothetical protein
VRGGRLGVEGQVPRRVHVRLRLVRHLLREQDPPGRKFQCQSFKTFFVT